MTNRLQVSNVGSDVPEYADDLESRLINGYL